MVRRHHHKKQTIGLFLILIICKKQGGNCLANTSSSKNNINSINKKQTIIVSSKEDQHPNSSSSKKGYPSRRQFVLHRDENRIKELQQQLHHDHHVLSSLSSSSSLLLVQKEQKPIQNIKHLPQKMNSMLKSTFLPRGYPIRTPTGYLSYSIWCWIQDLSTQLRSVIATQRILEGVGVGKSGATALSASLNFIVRDGCGMVSTLLFTACVSSAFRFNVKKWRLVADVMNDVGITLEVAATIVPRELFLPMICAGNMCKAICGTAAGACNGAINVHWSKGSDISDINAKFGAQHAVTGGLGLLFAALFAKYVSLSIPNVALWILYSTLTLLHVLANVKCLRLIALDYLNTERMDLIVHEFLNRVNDHDIQNENSIILHSPTIISKKESLFFNPFKRFFLKTSIRVGVSFEEIVRAIIDDQTDQAPKLVEVLISQLTNKHYIVMKDGTKPIIYVAFSPNANPTDKAKAYFSACLLRQQKITSRGNNDDDKISTNIKENVDDECNHLWTLFESNAKKVGWDLNKTELSSEGYCIDVQ